jgi:hypothetical protein
MSERENRARRRAALCEFGNPLSRDTSAEVEIVRQFSDHDVVTVHNNSDLHETGCWSNKVIRATTLDKAMDRGFASVNLLA